MKNEVKVWGSQNCGAEVPVFRDHASYRLIVTDGLRQAEDAGSAFLSNISNHLPVELTLLLRYCNWGPWKIS
jgi:hypothetical protein